MTNTITGTAVGETLKGTSGEDVILGLGGDDRIEAFGGDDSLDGGPGADRLFGGNDDDTVEGGDGDDYIEGSSGNDAVYGGDGDDRLFGRDGNDTLDGGPGADVLIGGDDDDVVVASPGDDAYRGGFGSYDDRFGIDTLTYEALAIASGISATASVVFGPGFRHSKGGFEILRATPFDDTISGWSAAETVYGIGGADTVRLRGGDDVFHPGGEGGRFIGGTGTDGLDFGGFTAGINLVLRGLGPNGHGYWEPMSGGQTGIIFEFEAVEGSGGDDRLVAGTLDATLSGGAGADRIIGSPRRDRIEGGTDDDVLIGRSGVDTFVFTDGAGRDILPDFEPGQDVIEIALSNKLWRPGVLLTPEVLIAEAREQGGSTVLFLNEGSRIVLDGVARSALSERDFRVVLERNLVATEAGDTLIGTGADNRLDGRGGNDLLLGLDGADTFVSGVRGGRDIVLDFDPSEDRLAFETDIPGLTAADVLAGAVEQDGSAIFVVDTLQRLVLKDVPLAEIDVSMLDVALADGIRLGTEGDDWLFTGDGSSSTLFAFGGNDVIRELLNAPASDLIDAGPGDDTIRFPNFFFSYEGDAVIDVRGGTGFDTLVLGTTPVRVILGEPGEVGFATDRAGDVLRLFDIEAVEVFGEATLIGNEEANVFEARAYADVIVARGGDDTVFSGSGNDTVYGGDGDDFIDTGPGFDRALGGAGADTFYLGQSTYGRSRVIDFVLGEDKVRVEIEGVADFAAFQPFITETAGWAILGAGTSARTALIGVAAADLSAEDFIFV